MKLRLSPIARIAATLLAAALPAQAHDVVLLPTAQGLTVKYGHPQDWLFIDGEKLIELKGRGAEGDASDRQSALKPSGKEMLLAAPKGQPMLYEARYDNGYWVTLTGPDGKSHFRNAGPFMVPGAKDVLLSLKYAKGLDATRTDTGLYKRNVGHLLELVPQKNPLALKADELLPVLVLFDGKPLADAGVENSNGVEKLDEDKIPRYRSDANGIAQIKLRAKGVNTLAVDIERPNDSAMPGGDKAAPANKVLMVATYTFVR